MLAAPATKRKRREKQKQRRRGSQSSDEEEGEAAKDWWTKYFASKEALIEVGRQIVGVWAKEAIKVGDYH